MGELLPESEQALHARGKHFTARASRVWRSSQHSARSSGSRADARRAYSSADVVRRDATRFLLCSGDGVLETALSSARCCSYRNRGRRRWMNSRVGLVGRMQRRSTTPSLRWWSDFFWEALFCSGLRLLRCRLPRRAVGDSE